MTAVCAGGSSQARAGFGTTVNLSQGALSAAFGRLGLGWAIPLAGFLQAYAADLANFCTVDPPAVPTISAGDIANLISPIWTPGKSDAIVKFNDLIGAFLWNDLCECSSGTSSWNPSAPSAPSGIPDINPPEVGPPLPPSGACGSFAFSGVANPNGTDENVSAILPLSGATFFDIAGQFDDSLLGASPGLAIYVTFFNASGTPIASRSVGGVPGTVIHYDSHATFATTVSWQFATRNYNSAVPIPFTAQFNLYCGGATPGSPGNPIPIPCAPDPLILAMLTQLKATVDLIQRQAVPFGYIDGPSHTGLTGDGTLSVADLIGARVTITDFISGTIGVTVGEPDYLWGLGWINWGSGSSHTPRELLEAEGTLSLPLACGAYTNLSYSLAPGVEATITELVREP